MGKSRLGTKNHPALNSNRIWLDEDLLFLLLSYKKLSARYRPHVCFEMIGRELGRSVRACASQLSLLRTGKTKISLLAVQAILDDVSNIDFDINLVDDANKETQEAAAGHYADLDSAQEFIRNLFNDLHQKIETLEALNDKLISENEALSEQLEKQASRDEDAKKIAELESQLSKKQDYVADLENWLREEKRRVHELTHENIHLIQDIEKLREKLKVVMGIRRELEEEEQAFPPLKVIK
jgi:chromosome segregation ATPase